MDKAIKEIPDSPIYFLGISDKFNEPIIAYAGQFPLMRKDIIGLRDFYFSHIFPFSGESFHIILLMDNNQINRIEGKRVVLTHENGTDVGYINLQKIEKLETGNSTGIFATRFTVLATQIPGICPLPGQYSLYLEEKEGNTLIGRFELYHQPALPFTKERIQALKTDPLAFKYVNILIECKDCKSSIKVVAGIDKEKLKASDVWYEDVPEKYECTCGKVKQNMSYIKNNLHGLLGYKSSPFSLGEQIEKNYTHTALENIANKFWELIENEETKEEELQKFIEKHPIILSQFSAELLKFKAPIGSMFETDFVLLNQKKEICLIEIEKATTPLFTKKGIQHSKFIQSVSQVEDWLKKARRNRLALLDDLKMEGINIDDVTGIRGIVIAGRSLDKDKPYIEKIRERKDIEFYTYDDLFKYLRQIILKVTNV